MHASPSGGSKFQAIPGPPGYAADSTPQRIRRVGQVSLVEANFGSPEPTRYRASVWRKLEARARSCCRTGWRRCRPNRKKSGRRLAGQWQARALQADYRGDAGVAQRLEPSERSANQLSYYGDHRDHFPFRRYVFAQWSQYPPET